MKEEFIKLDSFLDFYLDEERNFIIEILQLVNLVDSRFPTLTWKEEDWKEILKETVPLLKNVILLLEDVEFREIKFENSDFGELGFSFDTPLFRSYLHWIDSERYFLKACSEGKIKLVKYLLEKFNCNPTAHDNCAIQMASKNGHLEVVKYLYSIGCNPTVNDNWAIRWASRRGHLEVVKYLHKEAGCDPRDGNNCAIKWTSENGHLEVVKYLYSSGCDPNSAFVRAIIRGHLEIVKYFHKEAGCDPTTGNNYALRLASKYDRVEVVKYLQEEAGCSL